MTASGCTAGGYRAERPRSAMCCCATATAATSRIAWPTSSCSRPRASTCWPSTTAATGAAAGGRGGGRPSERGTYLDARAARAAMVSRDGVDDRRLLYLGESLGGAVALVLALEQPPAGVILQSAFTS